MISQSLYWFTENLTPQKMNNPKFIGNNRTVEDIRGYLKGANISADQGLSRCHSLALRQGLDTRIQKLIQH